MKRLVKYINEGWVGAEGNEAYEKLDDMCDTIDAHELLSCIWNYLDDRHCRLIYKGFCDDGYIDCDDDE